MITPSTVASALGIVGSLPWIVHLAHLALHRDDVIYLAKLPDSPPGGGWPTLAVAFAARDEAAMVERAARSMLELDYPGLEVIAVDDRSVDGTGAILDGVAATDGRLRVVHVGEPPTGWLGKTHALQSASGATPARWILFTDGDVVFEPGAMKRAVAFAEARGLDHLTVGPDVPTVSAGERLFLALFGLLFSMNAPLGKLADPRSKAHAGIGAFNLVRAESFRAIGGFRHLALSVDDDMRLGQALKFAGYRMRMLLGHEAVSVRWQVGLGGMIRGLEKNFFGAIGYRIEKAAVLVLALIVAGVMPYVGLFVGPWWSRVGCAIGVGAIAVMLGAGSRQSQIGWYYAGLIPVAALATIVALARSTVLTLWRRGVSWRGRLYPIGELKDHVRRRDAWFAEVWRSTH